MRPYDIWAPTVNNPPVIPYKQSVEWICEPLKPLGDEYVSIEACMPEYLNLDTLLKVPYVEPGLGYDLSPDGSQVAFSWN